MEPHPCPYALITSETDGSYYNILRQGWDLGGSFLGYTGESDDVRTC